MTTLLCLGFGYCALHYVAEFGSRFERVIGTATTPDKARRLAASGVARRPVEALVFAETRADPTLTAPTAAILRVARLQVASEPLTQSRVFVPTMGRRTALRRGCFAHGVSVVASGALMALCSVDTHCASWIARAIATAN